MAAPSLFIGVVSHPNTRFLGSQGSEGLGRLLAERVPGAVSHVSVRNLFDETNATIDSQATQAALSAELVADYEWSRYLGRTRFAHWWLTYAGRWVRRLGRRVKAPSPNAIRRLLNIEFAHLDLIARALASGAPWIMILEDDAVSPDVTDLALGVESLMSQCGPRTLINLSSSFTYQQLGIHHLLAPSQSLTWDGIASRSVLQAERAVTNTVCAIAYSRDLLIDVDEELRRLPVFPVIPIDWKLNRALLHLTKSSPENEFTCLMIDPAPIIQMSMR